MLPKDPAAAAHAAELEHYLPLVTGVVRRFLRRLPSSVEEGDLVAAGMFGLMDALKRSPDRGPAFEWYARVRIRGAMIDELRNEDWLTRRARAKATLAKETGGAGGHTRTNIDDLSPAAEASITDTPSPLDLLEQATSRAFVAEAIKVLPEREQLIVRLYYFEDHRFRAIADELGVSEPRVSQLHARALGRLKKQLEARLEAA
jgi:RNA polymerase sigma factor for flagellar operon FliA